LGQGNGPVFFPLSVMHGHDTGVEIDVLNTKVDAFGQAEPTAIQHLHDQFVRIFETAQVDRL